MKIVDKIVENGAQKKENVCMTVKKTLELLGPLAGPES